jgi:hypothetical protein
MTGGYQDAMKGENDENNTIKLVNGVCSDSFSGVRDSNCKAGKNYTCDR